MQTNHENNLQSYFTNRDHLREMFSNFVSAQKLPKRLIVLHGVGGVGKSSLLSMFRLHCEDKKIPVALALGDDAKSVLDIITRWADDLEEDGIRLRALRKTLDSYREIDIKVKKEAGAGNKILSKMLEAAGGATVGAIAGLAVPVIGTAMGVAAGAAASGMGMDAILRSFLSKSEADLWSNPVEKLTADFLEDMAQVDENKRIVLLLDTFEKMTTLEDWICKISQKINPNVLIVIAGRELPKWNKIWIDWMMKAEVEEIKPLSESDMRLLINRYYKSMRGGDPDPEQVNQIIKFTSFLPLEVATIVNLWVEYGIEDFQTVKSEGIASVVDCLMEGVPKNLIPLLEAAAVARWFDQSVLRSLLNKDDVRDDYNELRRFPFVKSRKEGLALHDSFRDAINKNLKIQDPDRYSELHECAAIYFEKRLEKVNGEDKVHLGLERLYHRVCADEEIGMKLFQETAEELVRYHFVNRLQTLLNDVNTYPLEQENSILWRKYYFALLLSEEWAANSGEVEKFFNDIIKNSQNYSYLRAKTLLRLMDILNRDNRYVQPGTPEKITSMLQECGKLLPENDWEQYLLRIRLATHNREISTQATISNLEKVFEWCKNRNDYFGLASTCQWIKGFSAMHGYWKELLEIEKKVVELPDVGSKRMLWVMTYSGWQIARVWMGRYKEAEEILTKILNIQTEESGTKNEVHRDIWDAVAFQGRAQEIIPNLEKECSRIRELGQNAVFDLHGVILHLGIAYMCSGDLEKSKECLVKSEEIISTLSNDHIVHEERYFLGVCCLIRREWSDAEKYFSKYLDFPFEDWFLYFKCGSLVGTARAKEEIGEKQDVLRFLEKAEPLAQQHEYNDHLSAIRLMEGHQALMDGNQSATLACYQKAMIHALRYNRFLLDDLISGRPQGTPMTPIIQFCLEHGEDGRKILTALRDWWKIGLNDVGAPRPDTISLITEGIALLEAEKIAREYETGDGSIQKGVVEQFDAALL